MAPYWTSGPPHRAWNLSGSEIFLEKNSFQFLYFSHMKGDPFEGKALSLLTFRSEILGS